MTGVSKEWLVVLAFFVGFFASTAVKTIWINRRTAADFPRSLFVAFGSNIFAVTVGYFFSFLIMAVVLGVVWDEPVNQMSAPNAFMWAAVTAAVLSPILVAGLLKRLLIKAARLERIERPWLYSFLATLLFNVSATIAPALVAYFL